MYYVLLFCKVSAEKSADSLKGVPCMWFFVFLLAAFRIFSLAFAFYYYMFLYRSLWIHLVRDSVLSALGYLIPSSDSQNFQPSFHQIHFDPFLSPHSGTLPVRMLECSMLSQKFLKLFFFFFFPHHVALKILSSSTRNQTQAHSSKSAQSQSLDHQGIPKLS